MEETGGLGVDCILDNLGSSRKQGYSKKELLQILAVYGRWSTTYSAVQVYFGVFWFDGLKVGSSRVQENVCKEFKFVFSV
jgi:hypothetical protein